MIRIITLIILVNFIYLQDLLLANVVEIKIKIQDEIITNVDVENEIKYLFFLNTKLQELDSSKINKIAIDSLINEIIKKKEVEKIFDLNKNYKLLEAVENNLILKKNLKSKEEFMHILNKRKLNYNNIRQKLLIEALWNQMIYKKYSGNVVINRDELKRNITNELNKNNKKFSYNLSEIFFSPSVDETIEERISKISKSIKSIGFENTANIYSTSNTSNKGGLIGWVNELQISKIISSQIKDLKINQVSKPIKVQNGFILIKLNDKKEFDQKIDIDEELKKLITNETNRQLNNFSTIYYKKLKKNIDIDEF